MKITIEISKEQLLGLKNLLSSNLIGNIENYNLLKNLVKSIQDSVEGTTITYDELKEENERLVYILAGLKFQLGIREALLSYHGSNMGL